MIYSENMPNGKRLRLVGPHKIQPETLNHDSLEFEPILYDEYRKVVEQRAISPESNLDVWVTIQHHNEDSDINYCRIIYDDCPGYGKYVSELIDYSELNKLAQCGDKEELKMRTLSAGLSHKCYEEGLTPLYEPSLLLDLHQNGLLSIGQPLIVDGIHHGEIKDMYTSGQDIFVTTADDCLFTTINIQNEYIKQSNPCYAQKWLREEIDIEPMKALMLDYCDSIDCKYYNLETRNGRINRYEFKESLKNHVFNNQAFMISASNMATAYARTLGFNDVSELSNAAKENDKDAQTALCDILTMIKCEMVYHGYREIPGDRPSPQSIKYLQELGYSKEAMEEKASILSRWLNDKQLTINERIAAEAIATNKSIYTLTNIEPGSLWQKTKPGDLFYDSAIHNDLSAEPTPYKNGAIKLRCERKDLSSGEITSGAMKIPGQVDVARVAPYGSGRHDDIVAISNDMICTFNFDVSNEYQMFGGYNSDRALLYLQEQNWQQEDNELNKDIETATQEIEQGNR